MQVSQFLTRLNYVLRGTDDDAPAFGSDEANYWLDTLNRKKDELYQDVTKLWRNTFEVRSVGAVSTAVDYDLDDDFLAPSDKVYIVRSDDGRTYYDLIQPQERQQYYRQAYISSMNPAVLTFTTEIDSGENIIGGTLYVPGYYLPADLTDETDQLPFLDPNWAVMAVAAEIAFNDIVYEDKAGDLNAKANNLYSLMVKRNRRGTYSNPRTAPTAVNRIRGPIV